MHAAVTQSILLSGRIWKPQLDIPLQAILGSKSLYEQHFVSLNQWSKVSLRIWFKECKSPSIERQSRLLRWVAFDLDFKPARIDGRFKYWYRIGVTSYYSISLEGVLDSFQKLSDTYGLEKSDFFRYLQTRTYFNAEIELMEKSDTNLIDIFVGMYKNKGNRKLVSKLHSCIQSNKKHSTNKIRLKWEKECGLVITEEDWLYMCSVQSTSTSSGLWREFCWRNLMRYFITPKLKSVQMGEMGGGLCWRNCGEQLAGHYHIFWGCPVIQSYWQGVTRTIQKVFGAGFDCSFPAIYLGNNAAYLLVQDRYLLKILLAASKKAVTRKWLQADPPAVTDWKDIVNTIQNMERMTFSLNLRVGKFLQYWEKWIVFVTSQSDV